MRYTPENIMSLNENEIFVFGSNLSGSHGGGAARTAHKHFGAKWGKGIGASGRCYAIPTKATHASRTLSLSEIKSFIDQFILHAIDNPDQVFLVTKIGCGLAGYSEKDIAPLFTAARTIPNIILPIEFHQLQKA
jgi:hypothetical protein